MQETSTCVRDRPRPSAEGPGEGHVWRRRGLNAACRWCDVQRPLRSACADLHQWRPSLRQNPQQARARLAIEAARMQPPAAADDARPRAPAAPAPPAPLSLRLAPPLEAAYWRECGTPALALLDSWTLLYTAFNV